MNKLSDHVDWQFLFREFWHLYRFGSAGGNAVIRSHLKEVRNRLNAELERNPRVAFEQPVRLPVCAWLNRAIDRGLGERTAPMVRSLIRVSNQLTWKYGYERMRPELTEFQCRRSSRFRWKLTGRRLLTAASTLIFFKLPCVMQKLG